MLTIGEALVAFFEADSDIAEALGTGDAQRVYADIAPQEAEAGEPHAMPTVESTTEFPVLNGRTVGTVQTTILLDVRAATRGEAVSVSKLIRGKLLDIQAEKIVPSVSGGLWIDSVTSEQGREDLVQAPQEADDAWQYIGRQRFVIFHAIDET